jgi:hypothetical protein
VQALALLQIHVPAFFRFLSHPLAGTWLCEFALHEVVGVDEVLLGGNVKQGKAHTIFKPPSKHSEKANTLRKQTL